MKRDKIEEAHALVLLLSDHCLAYMKGECTFKFDVLLAELNNISLLLVGVITVQEEPENKLLQDSCRKEVWAKAWIAVAGGVGCTSTDTANEWADRCLTRFDERFKS